MASMYPQPVFAPFVSAPRVPGIANQLAEKIADYPDDPWVDEVYGLLAGQSDEVLKELLAASETFSRLHWDSLDMAINSYMTDDREERDDEFESMQLSEEEFFLRLAFSVIPVIVHVHEPMLNESEWGWSGGEYVEHDESDLHQSVSTVIDGLFTELPHNENSLRIANGVFLLGEYVGDDESPSQEQVEWISEHAMSLLGHEDKVFSKGFNYELAKEIVNVETPLLRNGVL